MVKFYLITCSRFDNNRTHDFRIINSRCAGYLLDHSDDEGLSSFMGLAEEAIPISRLLGSKCE